MTDTPSKTREEMVADLRSIPVPTIRIWPDAFWRKYYFTMRMYPEQPTKEEQDALEASMRADVHLLPCHNCREHYAKHVGGLEKAKQSQLDLALWLFSVQNDINGRQGRHVYSWDQSIEAVKRMCRGQGPLGSSRPEGGSSSSSTGPIPIWSIVLICLLAIAIGIGIGIAATKAKRKK